MKKSKMLIKLKRMTGPGRRVVGRKRKEEPQEKQIIMKGKVTAKVLNVRDEMSLDSNVIGKLNKNEIVEIIGIEDDWFEILFNDASAFVASKFINPLIKTGVVTAKLLNVRSLPNIESEVVGKLKKDKKVILLDELNNWYRIKYKYSFAYVSAKYIDLSVKKKKEFLYQNRKFLRLDLEPETKLPLEGSQIDMRVRQTYNKYGNLLKALSEYLGIDLASAIAVIAVESGGKGFDDGNVLIRFENHLFYKYWGKENEKVFFEHFKFNKDKRWLGHKFRKNKREDWQTFHGDQEKEHEVLKFARKLDKNAAYMSISMGLAQILGSNSKILGYENAKDMYDNFSKDIRYHILGLFDFLSPRMIKYLRNNEFVNFASYYNGKGQARRYGKWIQDHYEAFPEELV
ncbi:MAG: N-acetylmuramidase domain-containing protein [Bacteroidales bacterium]|nr:N-acetylmuramidase domain-containing protein [Bacteroidales bacterium]